MDVQSYTAAGVAPAKLLRDRDLCAAVMRGYIPPAHIQFVPTNRCNLACAFCSCANRDTAEEMSEDAARAVLCTFDALGANAVTITGGGEPTVWDPLENIIDYCVGLGWQVGMVTNGTRLDVVDVSVCHWVRVSATDGRDGAEAFARAADARQGVDWAVSYVLTATPDWDNLERYVRAADAVGATHVRVVPDLCAPDGVTDVRVEEAAYEMARRGVPDSATIYQRRGNYRPGARNCLVARLRPVIAPDGLVYPCCGVQYARDDQERAMAPDMAVCSHAEAAQWWASDRRYNGARCVRCYYGAYNDALAALSASTRHARFV